MHPTQFYEAAFLAVLAVVLIACRKRGRWDREVVGLYLVSMGAFRFALEFIRVNPTVALGLTTAQWASASALVAGILLIAKRLSGARPS